MTKSLKSAILAATVVFAGALATPALADGHTAADKAIADAKEAYKQGLNVGGACRDTAQMISEAEKLLKAGKNDQAADLAREAEAQAMLGHIQATSQTLGSLHID